MKRKTIKTVFVMAILGLLSFNFVGCNGGEEPDPYDGKTGVFKVEIEMSKTGENDVAVSGSFVGSTKSAENAKLYKSDGSYIGNNYIFSDVMELPNKTISFYTSKDAVNLFGSISFIVEKGCTFSYTIKGYFNDNKIKETSNKIIPTEEIISVIEEIDISKEK